MSKEEIFKKVAPEYYKRGLPVIPTEGKRPVIPKWSKYSNEMVSSIAQESWLATYPNKNVGLVLSKENEIIAIDYDGDLNDPIVDKIPYSPCERRGKKGFVRFYRYKKKPNKLKSRKYNAIKVEVFSDSGQVIVPPSIHPDTGTKYKWVEDSLLSLSIDTLPLVEDNLFVKLAEENKKRKNPEDSGRNNALFNECCRLKNEGLADEQITSNLIEFDINNHKIPWFSDESEAHKGDVARAVNDLVQRVKPSSSREWKKPKPLFNEQSKLPKYDLESLPDLMHSFCLDLSETVGAPLDFFVATLLSCLSSLISRNFFIIPKKNSQSWKIRPNFFTLIVGAPGTKKTPSIKLGGIEQLTKVDSVFQKIDEARKSEVSARKKEIEMEFEKLKENPGENSIKIQELEYELSRLKPKLVSILFNNITPASLIEILGLTNSTVALFKDELSSLFNDFNSKDKRDLREIVLEG